MVQRVLPSPWPETVVPTMEEGEQFLSELAAQFQEVGPAGPPDSPPPERAAGAQEE
ncbi:unnamed protein product, partial [Prorocentrum cordatum]